MLRAAMLGGFLLVCVCLFTGAMAALDSCDGRCWITWIPDDVCACHESCMSTNTCCQDYTTLCSIFRGRTVYQSFDWSDSDPMDYTGTPIPARVTPRGAAPAKTYAKCNSGRQFEKTFGPISDPSTMCLLLEGHDDICPHNRTACNGLTIMAWIKLLATSYTYLYSIGPTEYASIRKDSQGSHYTIDVVHGLYGARCTVDLSDDWHHLDWHHLAVVYEDISVEQMGVKVYVDTNEVPCTRQFMSDDPLDFSKPGRLAVGCKYTGRSGFSNKLVIDEFNIFNRPLLSSEFRNFERIPCPYSMF